MSDDKIAEIRARHSRDDRWRNSQAHDDRALLLAEIERLREENERLRAEMLHLAEWCEMEVPLTHDSMSYRLRKTLEIKQ